MEKLNAELAAGGGPFHGLTAMPDRVRQPFAKKVGPNRGENDVNHHNNSAGRLAAAVHA